MIDTTDKDVKAFARLLKRLEKRNILLDIVADMIVLLDNNEPPTPDDRDRIIDNYGGCG